MRQFLVIGIFWLPVFVVFSIYDVTWWASFYFMPPFAVGMALIEQGTKRGWFD